MRHRRRLVALVFALSWLWVAAGTLHAITNGRPDWDDHPYVAYLLFYAPDSTGESVPSWSCSGSLIAPTVVLTAGHCTDGATSATVFFRSDLTVPDQPGIDGAPYTHPRFSWDWSHGLRGWDAVDSGVVVLQRAVTDRRFAELPGLGDVDRLTMGTAVDLVGYGVQFTEKISGSPYWRWATNWQRYYAPTQIVASENLNADAWLKLGANPGKGQGGICYGDSGGPDLLAGTDVILATNSFVGDTNCAGITYSNRVDRAVVLDWVNSFLR
jgi:hypothetical protein